MSEFSVTPQGGFLLIEFQGQPILNASVSEATGKKLQDLVNQGNGEALVLDFSRVQLMTSAMIGEFMKLHRLCGQKGVKLLFFNLSKDLMEVLKVCRLEKVFQIASSREAIAKLVSKSK